MSRPVEIFVQLLDEAVEVWRPVLAERIAQDTYRISDQPYQSDSEQWEFEPGEVVTCVVRDTGEGDAVIAVARADG
jgi:hypothetical protein